MSGTVRLRITLEIDVDDEMAVQRRAFDAFLDSPSAEQLVPASYDLDKAVLLLLSRRPGLMSAIGSYVMGVIPTTRGAGGSVTLDPDAPHLDPPS
jgi:hypothetical protein